MADTCLIRDFRVIRPAHSADHAASVEWLSQAHARSEASARSVPGAPETGGFDQEAFRRSMVRHITRFGCGPESLARRGHDLEDFLHLDWSRMRIFDLEKDARGAGMSVRMAFFEEIADGMADRFYPGADAAPDEIIHVTCTGYVAPSAVQKLVARRGWQEKVGVTHAYHMGCYASMPALKIASGYLAQSGAGRVDVVHTEICTLHLDPSRHQPEQLVVQSLFADGHIRYSVVRGAAPGGGGGPGLRLLAGHEEIIPGSLGAMGWLLGDRGMRMILAREVPELIAASLQGFLRRLLAKAGVDPAEALARGVFAVHPGGPRIIDKVAQLLELAPAQVAASRKILRAYGNMSSATLPHVWADLLADSGVPSGALIVSLAFGPGLTVYGNLLRKA